MPITNARVVSSLQFKDGSHYSGQVLDSSSTSLPTPHGYGLLTTPQSFSHRGHFSHGHAHGPGTFRAPNGDTFHGRWGADHRREGKGLFIRGADGLQLVEEYKDGKLDKRVKRRPPAASVRHWLASAAWDGGIGWKGEGPCARAGHTMSVTEDEGMLVVFGGETVTEAGITTLLNDLHLADLSSLTWLSPATSGTPPPPMHAHTATVVGQQLIVIGGQLQGLESSSSVYALDLRTGAWSTLLAHSLPFAHHTSTYVRWMRAVVTLQHDKVFAFSMDTHQWTACDDDRRGLKRTPRSFIAHAAVAVGEDIWVVGGKVMGGAVQGGAKAYEKCTGDVRVLHTRTMTWSVPDFSLPASPSIAFTTPRAHPMVVLRHPLLYVYGGLGTLNPSLHAVDEMWEGSVVVLDVERKAWVEEVAGLCPGMPRAEGGLVRVGGQLWAFGGRNAGEAAMKEWAVLDMAEGVEVGGKKVVGRKEEAKEALSEGTGAFHVVVPEDSVVGSGSVLDAFRAQHQGAV